MGPIGRKKKGLGVTNEVGPEGIKVSSDSIPHIWIVRRKLHRTDILAVVAWGTEDRCDALGLSLWEKICGSEVFNDGGLSSLVV